MKVLTPFKLVDDNHSRKGLKKILKIAFVIFIILFIVVGLPTLNVLRNVKKTQRSAKVLVETAKQRDFSAMKASIGPLQKDLKSARTSLIFLKYLAVVPFVRNYYFDAENLLDSSIYGLDTAKILVEGIEPYAESLGLKEKTQTAQQAENRAKVLVNALNALLPVFDKVQPSLSKAKNEIDQVDSNRYPKSIFGLRPREQLATAKNFVDQFETVIVDFRPAIEVLPEVLGDPKQKSYLILFQNDKEIRPSGGFLTAYTYLKADKGEITTSGSDDIYSLDETIDKICLNVICNLKPPIAIAKYLPEPTGKSKQAIESRDSNISPDFKIDAQEFTRFYKITGKSAYDGIIAVDTFLVKDLLEVLGPVKVAGYETAFDKDNVVDALEGYSEVVFSGQGGRKSVLGDLMNSIFLNALRADSSKLIPLFETTMESLNEKHVLLYFNDEKHQQVFEDSGWGGRITSFDGDYLHINDSNFAGGKAGLFVTQEVDQDIKIEKDGTIKKTVTIKYKNQGKYNAARNPGFRDWVRVFVPKGSELLSSKGSQNEVLASEDLGKTVFEAFHVVRPGGFSTLQFEYKLPFKYKKDASYPLLIQKQPGTDGFRYRISLNGKKIQEFLLQTDQKLELKV